MNKDSKKNALKMSRYSWEIIKQERKILSRMENNFTKVSHHLSAIFTVDGYLLYLSDMFYSSTTSWPQNTFSYIITNCSRITKKNNVKHARPEICALQLLSFSSQFHSLLWQEYWELSHQSEKDSVRDD